MDTSYIETIRQFSRNIKLFVVVSGVVAFCFFGIYAILYNLFLLRLGYGPVFIGLANGIIGLGYALSSFPAGILGGKFGYRQMMIVGALVCLGASTLLPAALFLSGTLQATWLVATYGLYGSGGALILVNGVPFMMASSRDEERDHVFAVTAAIPAVAGFAGSIVGGLLPELFQLVSTRSLEEAHPYAYSMWSVPAVYVLMLLALSLTTPVSGSGDRERVDRATGPPYRLVVICSLVVLLRVSIYFAVSAFFNVHLDTLFHTPPSTIGMLAAIGRLAAVPGALLSPLLVLRWGRHRTVLILLFLLLISGLPISFISQIPAVVISLVAITAATYGLDAVFSLYSQKITGPEHRGTMSGALALGTGIGYAFTTYGGGFVIEQLGFQPLYLLCCVLVVAAAIVFVGAFGQEKARTLRALADA